ncbi:non-hydrolyzing UDP-N-acetylglucosamine 2-epimerase [Undibacterium sp.]|uniref:non-hydrolyzing UDP-N-acetylglucosamine 2-epimerase n=1 Tax=Undibacterium sp. TaxID=1914977 RepID=UPI00374DA954
MNPRKRLTCALIVGTRPEAIKLAPVYLAMRERADQFLPLLWITGQHRELLDQVLEVFGLQADADFALMVENQSQTALVGKILQSLDPLMTQHRPDWIVVQGDTSSAMAGALGGFYAGIPVAHVEAGLRTYNLAAPFPEEGNRQIISRVARLHCAPTAYAAQRLLLEQLPAEYIVETGNTVVDAIRWVAQRHKALPEALNDWAGGNEASGRKWVLTTLHRRESFGATLEGMLHAIRSLADDPALGLAFVFPVHPNPNVQAIVHRILGNHPHIALLPPLGYTELAAVLAKCWLVLTDSGGLQEEAPSLHKPVLVLREVTERPEGVETGAAELVGTDPATLIASVRRLVTDQARYERMAGADNPYGNGAAASAILDAMLAAAP